MANNCRQSAYRKTPSGGGRDEGEGEGTKAGVALCENEVCETGTNLAGIVIATTRGARIKEGGINRRERRRRGSDFP